MKDNISQKKTTTQQSLIEAMTKPIMRNVTYQDTIERNNYPKTPIIK